MPVFYVKREFFEALLKGRKKAEMRVGEIWVKLAEKIRNGKIRPIAVFRWRDKVILREIYRIEIYPSIRRALASGRWKLLGLKAKTYPEAVEEIRKLYMNKIRGPSVIFWLRRPKKTDFST